jgi:hypothetical protein
MQIACMAFYCTAFIYAVLFFNFFLSRKKENIIFIFPAAVIYPKKISVVFIKSVAVSGAVKS